MTNETNPLTNGHDFHAQVDYTKTYTLRELADARGKVTRIRILAEGSRYDISYIIGTLPDGQDVPVRPWSKQGLLFRNIKGDFILWGKEERVFAHHIGLLDKANWSILR